MVVKVAGRRYICKGAVLNICTMDKGKFFSGLAIMLGLVVMGSMLPKGLNDIKPQMIEEATQNAREAAQQFAEDSGSRLGKIKTASQGTFTIEDRDSNTPYIKKVRVVSSVTYYLKN